MIRDLFPEDQQTREKVAKDLSKFKLALKDLIYATKDIEETEEKLSKIPILSNLIITGNVHENLLAKLILPTEDTSNYSYEEVDYDNDIVSLNKIDKFLNKNPLIKNDQKLISDLKEELKLAYKYSNMEKKIREIIKMYKDKVESFLNENGDEQQNRKLNFDKLLILISKYISSYKKFKDSLNIIADFKTKFETQKIDSMGHTLFIENTFVLDKQKFIEVINEYLKTSINSFDKIMPNILFKANYKERPKVKGYEDFKNRVSGDFDKLNKRTYRIKTNSGRDYENLSAGWKTSIILDLILGHQEDMAPLIVDQPEDNLATGYINKGLIDAVKTIKVKKQVILVTHNATIPMLGDAQNIILCESNNNKIVIRSARLEEYINGISMIDHIAKITDGGKSSIKKRFKKYNLRKFKE